ncbi:MAG: septal ring lytic transglycosylase RlpA family protein [Acidobacteria bacterium]|nr:septal ring lytic transglycosylase RlpA family protein [Acidobacteriota bacterium]
MRKLVMGCAVAALVAISAQSVARPPASVATVVKVVPQDQGKVGVASWYGEECQGNLTASGEVFDLNGLTAAHWEYPFGTRVKITNLKNNKSVVVRVNDRGPGIEGRLIDVSMAAAQQLGFLNSGLTDVRVEVVSAPTQKAESAPETRGPAPGASGK